jgi:hypothetical protein
MWLMRIMVEQGLSITFFPARFKRPTKYTQQLLFLGVAVLPEADMDVLVAEMTTEEQCTYDLIVLSRLDNCREYTPIVREACPATPVIYDTVDIHFLRETRNIISQGKNIPLRETCRQRNLKKNLTCSRPANRSIKSRELGHEESRRACHSNVAIWKLCRGSSCKVKTQSGGAVDDVEQPHTGGQVGYR